MSLPSSPAPSPTAEPGEGIKSKTAATWIAFLGGAMGLHRFYLRGFGDPWGWLHAGATMLGAWGLRRISEFGQDDQLSWLLLPILGFTIAAAMLQAITYGLMPDEGWHARHNAHLSRIGQPLPTSGWAAVIGVVLSLLVGATVLMSTIAFSGQRYFEYQVEEARKISQ